MADITMCMGESDGQVCQQRDNCYRFNAPVTIHWQAYADLFNPKDPSNCEYFWPVYEEEKAKDKTTIKPKTNLLIKSSNISNAEYDESDSTLYVTFKGNSRYQYFDVPKKVVEDLAKADSAGKFLASNIKNIYKFKKEQ